MTTVRVVGIEESRPQDTWLDVPGLLSQGLQARTPEIII